MVDASQDITEEAPYKYVSKRASIVVLGPILARNGHIYQCLVAGPIEVVHLHLKGLEGRPTDSRLY